MQPNPDNNFEETYSTILEMDYNEIVDRGDLRASTSGSTRNKFKGKPQGIVITDTVNNPVFPIKKPMVDTSKMALPEIYKQFVSHYAKEKSLGILPWNYITEFYNETYMIHNTRPMDMVFPYNTRQVKEIIEKNDVERTDNTLEDFLYDENKEIQEYIHICLVGNSELDVYTTELYERLGRFIIGPLSKIYRFSPMIGAGVFPLNMGKKFKPKMLEKSAKG